MRKVSFSKFSVGLALCLAACSSVPGAEDGSAAGAGQPASRADAEAEQRYLAFLAELRPVEGGVVYQRDIFISHERDLREFWETHVADDLAFSGMSTRVTAIHSAAEKDGLGTSRQGLSRIDGGLQPRNANLKYCIRTSGSWSLSASQAQILDKRLQDAASRWRLYTGISFTHVRAEDGAGCDGTNNRVYFHVRLPTATELQEDPNFGGQAFYPDDPRASRILKVAEGQIVDHYNLLFLLLHETGHILGFQHEHVRASRCTTETTDGYFFTRYDSQSIMHYTDPECGATHAAGSTLSRYDTLGAQCACSDVCEWEQWPGAALDIGSGGGDVWIVGTNRIPYRFNPATGKFEKWHKGSDGARIAVDDTGTPWLVTSVGNLYRWDWAGDRWLILEGKAIDVGTGGGRVWKIGADRKMYEWDGGAFNVMAAGSDGHRITVDSTGRPWIVNTQGKIYRKNGNVWKQIAGAGTDIGAGSNGSIWLVGRTPVSGGYSLYQYQADPALPTWELVTGGATNIAVRLGRPWVTNSANFIYRNLWEY